MKALLERLEILAEAKGKFAAPTKSSKKIHGITVVPAEDGPGGEYAKRAKGEPDSWVLWYQFNHGLKPIGVVTSDSKGFYVNVMKSNDRGDVLGLENRGHSSLYKSLADAVKYVKSRAVGQS